MRTKIRASHLGDGEMAYLDMVKSNGKVYVYISKYVGKQEFSMKKEARIARLGRAEQALMTLKIWQIDARRIPPEIEKEFHNRIPEWIQQVRNRVAF